MCVRVCERVRVHKIAYHPDVDVGNMVVGQKRFQLLHWRLSIAGIAGAEQNNWLLHIALFIASHTPTYNRGHGGLDAGIETIIIVHFDHDFQCAPRKVVQYWLKPGSCILNCVDFIG